MWREWRDCWRRWIATFHLLLFPPLRCLLLLLILPFYISYEGLSLFSNSQAFGLEKTMMTAAVNFLRCGWSKKPKFITAHNVQWTPILLLPAIKGTSRTHLTVINWSEALPYQREPWVFDNRVCELLFLYRPVVSLEFYFTLVESLGSMRIPCDAPPRTATPDLTRL